MAVHMVRLYIEPPRGDAFDAVDNWVQDHNEWEGDPVEHEVTEVAVESATPYMVGDYRFEQDTGATALLDDLEPRLQEFQGGLWYRLGYHTCTHSDQDPEPCRWDEDETREGGDVPEIVPSTVSTEPTSRPDHPDDFEPKVTEDS